jgi:NAD(P)-dependent dehydrogenase (short-subunit alcohol dehydrogenase family)
LSRLPGSVVLVTGASRGIGRATARLLARLGATVVATGRDGTALAELTAEIGGSYLVADLTEDGAAGRIVQHALTEHGRLDGVVANAGVGWVGRFEQMPEDRIGELIDLNLRAQLLVARAAIGPLRAAGGSLVFVSSIAAIGVVDEAVYSASKAALEVFADVLREELRGSGVSVSTVLPGVVRTDLLRGRQLPYDRRFPRPMAPDRVARAVVAALTGDDRRLFRPRWLMVPARLAGIAPGLYRRLARRWG